MEEWKAVVGYEGAYEVSDQGRVRSLRFKYREEDYHMLKSFTNEHGYVMISLYKPTGKKQKRVHRLVLEAFVGPCPPGYNTNHKNFDRTDNRLENLEWIEIKRNLAQRIFEPVHLDDLSAKDRRWQRSGPRKLTERWVRMARVLHATGEFSYVEIAEVFGVTPTAIRYAVIGETWKTTG